MEGPPATPETGMVAVPRGRLLYRHVVVERVGRVAGVVVVVADERERVAAARRDGGGDLDPCAVVRAHLREDRRGRAGGVVPQRRGSPVVRQGVGAGDLVPERKRSAGRGGGEGLGDGAVAAGRAGGAGARRVGPRMPPGDRGSCAGGGPPAKVAGLEPAVHERAPSC